jgi:PadR family transcriptional regulator PadR
MPRGRRWRRGRKGSPQMAVGTAGAWAQSISRFVEPCLLLLLHRGDSHGYDLLERLKEFGFAEDTVDSSVVYRYLRAMEERGFVTSTWDTEGVGPPRRVYRLTAEGDQYLAWWISGLQETRNVLDRFLQAYEEHMELDDHIQEERMIEVDHRISS